MKLLVLFLSLVVFVHNVGAEIDLADGIKNIEPEIRRHINKQAKRYEVKDAYVSNIVRGDINGDRKEDVFVTYAIQGIGGGNFCLYFQSLFLNQQGRIVFKSERGNGCFGTAQGKTYIPTRMVRGKVLCKTLAFAPDDSVCCPTVKGEGEILLAKGKLIESKRTKITIWQKLYRVYLNLGLPEILH